MAIQPSAGVAAAAPARHAVRPGTAQGGFVAALNAATAGPKAVPVGGGTSAAHHHAHHAGHRSADPSGGASDASAESGALTSADPSGAQPASVDGSSQSVADSLAGEWMRTVQTLTQAPALLTHTA